MPEVPSVSVGPAAYRTFRKKAREFARSMHRALEAGDNNAAASAASHCVICACDALLARHRRIRSRAHDHAAALRLVEESGMAGARERVDKVHAVISLKHVAEYADREVRRGEAEDAVKRAKRFFEWAEENLPE